MINVNLPRYAKNTHQIGNQDVFNGQYLLAGKDEGITVEASGSSNRVFTGSNVKIKISTSFQI